MRWLLLAAAALSAAPAAAQDHAGHAISSADHSDAEAARVDHGSMERGLVNHSAVHHGPAAPDSGPPARAFEGPAHAADTIYGAEAMAPARDQLYAMHGGFRSGTIMLERLEARIGDGADGYLWNAQAWYGGDLDRLWIKSEGEGTFGGLLEDAEIQALWSHAIGPWFDLQAGARYDIEPRGRAHAVLGVQGLAPYMFEIDAAAFLSEKGDLTARAEAEYDQRITQRLILQPRAELSLAAQDVPELDLGAGFSSVEAGLRLRYEIAREFAPYVGVGYEAKLGETAELARAAGEDADGGVLLIGLRVWF